MGGRILPFYCEHGSLVDGGDFADSENCPECRMNNYEKTSKEYLEAWRGSQAEMQELRDLLAAERDKVRVMRETLEQLLAYIEPGYGDFVSDEVAQVHEAIATRRAIVRTAAAMSEGRD